MLGNVIHILVNANESTGYKSIQWNATNTLKANLYHYLNKIRAGGFVDTKKMIILK